MTAPQAKRQRLDLSETIVIVAGTGETAKEFTVHTTYATQSSSFIRAALSQDWKEGKMKRIAIPEAEPESLEGYLSWVYSKTITLRSSQTKCPHCKAQSTGGLCITSSSKELAQMYVLGDCLGDLRFCNAVMDTWVDASKATSCFPTDNTVHYVLQNTAAESPWRELYLLKWKELICIPSAEKYMKDSKALTKDFLIDLLAFVGMRHGSALTTNVEIQALQTTDKCKLHKHIDDSDKCIWASANSRTSSRELSISPSRCSR